MAVLFVPVVCCILLTSCLHAYLDADEVAVEVVFASSSNSRCDSNSMASIRARCKLAWLYIYDRECSVVLQW